jgi:hypothetical protein
MVVYRVSNFTITGCLLNAANTKSPQFFLTAGWVFIRSVYFLVGNHNLAVGIFNNKALHFFAFNRV